MNKPTIFIGMALLATGFGVAQGPQTFTGQIMDSACAKTGSHAAMEKEHGMKTAKDCTLGCVKGGAKFVLYNGSKSYDLDDQTKPEAFAGQKVKVTGTLDAGTNTIHVRDIKR